MKSVVECSHIQSTLSKTDTFGTGTKCPSYRESNKRSKERQGPTLGLRLIEVSVKRESTVYPEKFRQFYDSRMHATTFGNHSIRYIGPIVLSKLSMRIKSSEALSSFKKQQVRGVDTEKPPRTLTCKNSNLSNS